METLAREKVSAGSGARGSVALATGTAEDLGELDDADIDRAGELRFQQRVDQRPPFLEQSFGNGRVAAPPVEAARDRDRRRIWASPTAS